MIHPMKPQRILSLSPGARQIGYAYFEGDSLIDWGIRGNAFGTLPDRIMHRGLDLVLELVRKSDPDIVILPDTKTDTRRVTRNRFIAALESVLASDSLSVITCSSVDVKIFFSKLTPPRKPTKQAIMTSLAVKFPELRPIIPRPRRPWEPQDYWLPLFDAIARAVAWLQIP